MPKIYTGLCAFVIICLTAGCRLSTMEIAFAVDKIEVEREELIYYMKENAVRVSAEIENQYELDFSEDHFWNRELEGNTPLDILTDTAIERIARIKLEQQLAMDCGIQTTISYNLQRKQHEKQNRERKKAEAAGEVLYGPTERDFSTYFTEFYLAMKKKTLIKLVEGGSIQVTEDNIRQYYNDNAAAMTGDFEEIQDQIYSQLINQAYENLISSMLENAVIERRHCEVSVQEIE